MSLSQRICLGWRCDGWRVHFKRISLVVWQLLRVLVSFVFNMQFLTTQSDLPGWAKSAPFTRHSMCWTMRRTEPWYSSEAPKLINQASMHLSHILFDMRLYKRSKVLSLSKTGNTRMGFVAVEVLLALNKRKKPTSCHGAVCEVGFSEDRADATVRLHIQNTSKTFVCVFFFFFSGSQCTDSFDGIERMPEVVSQTVNLPIL